MNIELDVLRAQFARLTDKEQSILSRAFGVYGQEEQPLDDIALREMLTVNGVTKAKTRALSKLKELCESAGIHNYRAAEKEIETVQKSG